MQALELSDITHLLLQSYLSQTTGNYIATVSNWQNFDSSLMPRDDGGLAYAGAIWPKSFSHEEKALKQLWNTKSWWGLRLLISGNDVSEVTLKAHQWARILAGLLESVQTPTGQAFEGGSLAGTYEGLVVGSNAVISISRVESWQISVEENESGGGIAIVSTSFEVFN